jgi:hypothetical protein
VGRSGSGYISAVLNAAGVRCGHESWWNPLDEHQAGLDADSSWCALPDVLHGAFDGPIVMQVRHPLLTIASLTQSPDHGHYIGCRERLMGPLPEDPLRAATLTWLQWTIIGEGVATDSWRVEDVDADLVARLARLAGHPVTDAAAAAAVAFTSTKTNDHATILRLTWDDLPADLVGDVRGLAAGWGYQ